jgi:glycosyltransferase involved in cell wall biosynthesis
MTNNKPFFSIGVTSYKRLDLLKQCITSIISQTYSDFEILIGNDDTSTIITQDLLGISDNRVKIYNHAKNLGEIDNMNYLLSKAEGDFFTIQADDDLYEPQFLESIYAVIQLHNDVDCVYTKFKIVHGEDYPSLNLYSSIPPTVFEGAAFIHSYLEGKCRLMPVCGMFRTEMLIDMGGIKNPSNAPIGLFGEYILVLSLPLTAKVGYIDIPLVMYRVQFNRTSKNAGGVWNSTDLSQYKTATQGLIMVGARLFSQPQMKKHFMFDMSAIIALCMPDLFVKWIYETGRPRLTEIGSFFFSIVKSVRNELSTKYSIIVGLLLVRFLVIQFAYAKRSIVGENRTILFYIEKMLQVITRGLLFFVYHPPALFWRENDDD